MAIIEEHVECDIDVSGDGGVMKKILEEGDPNSQPMPQCQVSVNYIGWQDGEEFDSTWDRDEPHKVVLYRGIIQTYNY